MENIHIYLNFVDGSYLPVEASSGQELIHILFGEVSGAPPTVLVIEATTEDGGKVTIRIPYDERRRAFISLPSG